MDINSNQEIWKYFDQNIQQEVGGDVNYDLSLDILDILYISNISLTLMLTQVTKLFCSEKMDLIVVYTIKDSIEVRRECKVIKLHNKCHHIFN